MGDRGRVILREHARRDIEAAVDWYRDEAGEDTALRFVEALEVALDHVGRYPSSGSARYSLELGIPALRCWQLERFPYLAFCVERDDHSMCGVCWTAIVTSLCGCVTPMNRDRTVEPDPVTPRLTHVRRLVRPPINPLRRR